MDGQFKCRTLTDDPITLSLFKGKSQSTDKRRRINCSLQQKANVALPTSCGEQVVHLPEQDVTVELPAEAAVTAAVSGYLIKLCFGVEELQIKLLYIARQVMVEPCLTKQMDKLLFREEIPVRIL